MITKILEALRALNIADYRINTEKEETAELFFIGKKLDMYRTKKIAQSEVTVYRSFESDGVPMRGASTAMISPDMSVAEIQKVLAGAYDAAQYVKNPTFDFIDGVKEEEKPDVSGFAAMTLDEAAEKLSAAIFAAKNDTPAFLNSAELFVSRRKVRIVSSYGADVSFVKTGASGEFVVQCKEPNDVEQYFHFSYEEPDAAALSEMISKAYKTVCDRASATKCPKGGSYDVILSDENLKTLFEFYLTRSAAALVFAGYTDYKPGKQVQGEDVQGEKLNLTVVPSAPYSGEGIPMTERKLIEEGELRFIWGDTRFCRYLGTEPTGGYRRVRLQNGTLPFEEVKKGCLYPVTFSDFQMDAFSGNFGGEIRLAYLFTDEGVQVLTGGSINGSFFEAQKNLTFSKEKYTDADYEGPFAVRLRGVSVSGE